MICAWESYLKLMPPKIRPSLQKIGFEILLETRLRVGACAQLVTTKGSIWLKQKISSKEIVSAINAASNYSPWATATSKYGFISAPGGHRIGICGDSIIRNGKMEGIRTVSSLCIRLAKDLPGIAKGTELWNGSVLILGSPGSGKTTLLRDMIRCYSNLDRGCISVIDERCELFPQDIYGNVPFDPGQCTDVLRCCTKSEGIINLLRTMGPKYIAVDEITSEEDCDALIKAAWCGVTLLATAHAASQEDLINRPVYKPLVESKLFDHMILLNPDKTWKKVRI